MADDFDPTPEQADLLRKLSAFTAENFRAQRWLLIDAARKAGLTWAQIGEPLETASPGVIRMHRDQKPSRPSRSED